MTSWQQQCHLRDRHRWLDMSNNNVINNVNKATGGALNSVRTTYAAYVLKDLFLDSGCIDCRGSITPIATSGGVTSPGLLSPTARTFIFYLLTYCRPTYFYCIRSRPATVVSRLQWYLLEIRCLQLHSLHGLCVFPLPKNIDVGQYLLRLLENPVGVQLFEPQCICWFAEVINIDDRTI